MFVYECSYGNCLALSSYCYAGILVTYRCVEKYFYDSLLGKKSIQENNIIFDVYPKCIKYIIHLSTRIIINGVVTFFSNKDS